MKQALIIFAKNPVYGRVKTRLAATAGNEKALRVYHKLLNYTASITMGLGVRKFVFYSDAIEVNDLWSDKIAAHDSMAAHGPIAAGDRMAAHDSMAAHGPIAAGDSMAAHLVIKKLQRGNDLGERMHEAFNTIFDEGYNKVVIIGTDCPELDADTIVNAFRQLDLHDVVIGPAKDGGYYLLGLKKAEQSLFRNISWSSNKVFEETVEECRLAKLSTFVLQELSDIDTEQDLTAIAKFNPWIND